DVNAGPCGPVAERLRVEVQWKLRLPEAIQRVEQLRLDLREVDDGDARACEIGVEVALANPLLDLQPVVTEIRVDLVCGCEAREGDECGVRRRSGLDVDGRQVVQIATEARPRADELQAVFVADPLRGDRIRERS